MPDGITTSVVRTQGDPGRRRGSRSEVATSLAHVYRYSPTANRTAMPPSASADAPSCPEWAEHRVSKLTVDYTKDRVRMRMSHEAIGNPEQVRVSVRVAGTRRDGTSAGLVDWLGEPRSFTPWVARG